MEWFIDNNFNFFLQKVEFCPLSSIKNRWNDLYPLHRKIGKTSMISLS